MSLLDTQLIVRNALNVLASKRRALKVKTEALNSSLNEDDDQGDNNVHHQLHHQTETTGEAAAAASSNVNDNEGSVLLGSTNSLDHRITGRERLD